MSKKIVIIGAGISGLTAGIYGRLYGYDTLIIEKNNNVGGLCTSWKRKGYELDGCIHWLTGTKNGTTLNNMWRTIGALKEGEEVIDLPTWGSINYNGTAINFYADLEKAEKEWLAISPVDKKMIHHFFKMVKKIRSVELPLDAPIRFLSYKKLFKIVGSLIRTYPYYTMGMFMSCENYAKRFKNEALRFALTHIQPGAGNLYSMAFSYSLIVDKNGGIPVGGSAKMSENIYQRYLELGGEIRLNSEVIKINTHKKKAISVTLKNGEIIAGDRIISCLDSNYVLDNLLNNRYVYKQLYKRFNSPEINPAPSCVLVYFKMPLIKPINIPYSFNVSPFAIGNKLINHLSIRSYEYDQSFVKNGNTVLAVLIDQDSLDFDYWKSLYENKQEYLAKKNEIAELSKSLIEKHLDYLKGKLELLDVATPMTFSRYVNASRGSYMSYLFNPEAVTMAKSGRIHGLKNFRLSGQYMQTPGGLPLAMVTGKFSIDFINYEYNNWFNKLLMLLRLKKLPIIK